MSNEEQQLNEALSVAEKTIAVTKPKAVKKPAKRKAKKPAGPPPQYKVIPEPTRKSKALKQLGWQLRDDAGQTDCVHKGCKNKTTKHFKALWCHADKKVIRTLQLQLNNNSWEKRGATNKILPKVQYGGRPTEWAVEHKEKALEIAKKRVKAGTVDENYVEDVKKVLQKTAGKLKAKKKAA